VIPFLPGRHRRSQDDDVHARARRLASERVDEPLAEADATWLESHLATCAGCVDVTGAYEAQRAALRGLAMPEPPRDLWARTRAAIEAETASAAPRRSARRSFVPLGALSGALVVAVVVGASLLSTPVVAPSPSAPPSPVSPLPSSEPQATPIAVAAGEVGWLARRDDGTYALAYAPIDQVCQTEIRPDCPPIDARMTGTLTLTAVPRAVVRSPTQDQLVVVDASTRDTGGAVYVVAVPGPGATPSPSPEPSPSVEPSPSTPASPEPTPVPSPSPSGSPVLSPSPEPTASPVPSPLPSPGSPEPSVAPTVQPTVEPTTSAEPSPSADPSGVVAIADGVIVVGEAAAYSPDGHWFAFSARPADGSHGPDIYLWQVGDAAARPVTDDGRSFFSAWVGGRILGSRAVPAADPTASPSPTHAPSGSPSTEPSAVAGASPDVSPAPVSAESVSFLLDPESGYAQMLPGAGIWRPVVDPTGSFAVYWEGSIVADATGVDWLPGEGRLVVAAWDDDAGLPPPQAPSLGSPEPSIVGASPSPVVSRPVTVATGAIGEWDVQWDETGALFAVWVASAGDPNIGALSLHTVDRATGALDPDGPILSDVPALAGFSIGDGRLAWATPPGQDGQGSRLAVLAWSGGEAGQTGSQAGSGSDPIVVIR
jgi:hypothetical protein